MRMLIQTTFLAAATVSRGLSRAAIAAGALALLLLVAGGDFGAGGTARATNPPSMDAMSIDMDTTFNGNIVVGSAGEGDSLDAACFDGIDNAPIDGTINDGCGVVSAVQTCARINENGVLDGDETSVDAVTIDITAANIPTANRMIGWAATLGYNSSLLRVGSGNVTSWYIAARPGASLSDSSASFPNTDGSWEGEVIDLGLSPASAEAGFGVLARLVIESVGSGPVVTPLTLTGALHLDTTISTRTPDAVNGASVALDTPCPGAPAHENLASARVIGLGPYTDWTSTVEAAAVENGETTSYTGCQGDDPGSYVFGKTVWYKYEHTASDQTLQLDTIGSQFDTVVRVYTGPAASPTFGALTYVTCGDQEFLTSDAGLTFLATTGTTYYFQVGGFASSGPPTRAGEGNLALNLSRIVSTAGAVFTVNSTADTGDLTPDTVCDDGSGNCTLREAIQEANFVAGTDNIRFSVPPYGAVTISPATSLPFSSGPVVLDARTQPGFAGTPLVTLAGPAGGGSGLSLSGGSSSVRGLVVSGFTTGGGIYVVVAGDHVIQGNSFDGNNSGVRLETSGSWVGGGTVAARNVISGNQEGVLILGDTADGNVVAGNYIGTDAAGTGALGNSDVGVWILSGADDNLVGGYRNIIADNARGVAVFDAGTTGNLIQGNYIGTNANGDAPLGNSQGVSLAYGSSGSTVGGPSASQRNVITGNSVGIAIGEGGTASNSNVVQGNYIGVAADGVTALGNTANGVQIDSSSGNSLSSDVIANNGGGVRVTGATATGNWINELSYYNNGGLAIDTDTAGVNANDFQDTDTGANRRQNYPVLSSALTVGSVTTVTGSINTTPSIPAGMLLISFYSSPACDGTNGEGRTKVGSITGGTDANGDMTISATMTTTVPVGQVITAVAINANTSDTSEFSACQTVTCIDADADLVCSPPDNCPDHANPSQTNSDGDPAGDACDNDDDDDGYVDADETLKASDPLVKLKTPEHCDGLDEDGDTVVDDHPPGGGYNWDTDGDTIKDCLDPSVDTDGDTLANTVDTDDDGDGYSDTVEIFVSTDPLDKCPDNSSDDTHPLDQDRNGSFNVSDILKYKGKTPATGTSTPKSAVYSRRLDIDGNGSQNVSDIQKYKGKTPSSCT